MESMNGFLEKRTVKHALRLDSELDNIDGMVRNLQTDIDNIEIDSKRQYGVSPYELSMTSPQEDVVSWHGVHKEASYGDLDDKSEQLKQSRISLESKNFQQCNDTSEVLDEY